MVVGGVHPGVSPVLQGGDTWGTAVCVGFMCGIRRDDACGGGHQRGVFNSYLWEEGTVSVLKYLRGTGAIGGPTGSWDEVVGQINLCSGWFYVHS